MALPTVVLLGLILIPAYQVFCLCRNYIAARKLGLPIVILPFDNVNPVWLLLSRPVYRQLKRLGLGNLLPVQTGRLGWEYEEKAKPFVERGCNAIVQVTPGSNWVSVVDPAVATQVYQAERKGDIERPRNVAKMLDIFGPNVSTVHGADWQRMRKTTAASFNESTNRVVWTETLKQGRQVLKRWMAAGEDGVNTTATDTRMIAMSVLMRAGFGQEYDFGESPQDKPDSPGGMDYREAIHMILTNAILLAGIGPDNLSKLRFLSKKIATLADAVVIFKRFMIETLDQGHKGQYAEDRGNLLANLVRALHEDKQLNESEVFGNTFVYIFGGHDTTAHSLAFTFVLLSIYPEVQEWMREELRQVLKDEDPQTWTYDCHTKLKRTLAVQYETLRLFNPLLGISKEVPLGRAAQVSFDGGKTVVTVPGGTQMTVNTNAISNHPDYWGPDSTEWKPSRWIRKDDDGSEQFIVPDKGSFLAWSDGFRKCPGKKFGQVEHMALMASIFRNHAVEAAAEKGESAAQTKDRIMDVIRDSGMILNVQMYHPENAKLVWRRCKD